MNLSEAWTPASRPSLRILGALLLCLAAARWVSFDAGLWLLAVLAFAALREYLSLADLRPEDRWAMLAAYLSVPFAFYLVQINWYGFFIVSIPVYVFLVVPFLVAVGSGRARGGVFSIGAIDFGLFLFVYCLGHLAYLARFSLWIALFLVLGVALSDFLDRLLTRRRIGPLLKIGVAVPPLVVLSFLICGQTSVPRTHVVALGALLPVLVLMSNYTLAFVEEDLGIDREHLEPGRGRMIDGLRGLLFAAPVVFHYLHYFYDAVTPTGAGAAPPAP